MPLRYHNVNVRIIKDTFPQSDPQNRFLWIKGMDWIYTSSIVYNLMQKTKIFYVENLHLDNVKSGC